jgi:hypothetical protein
MTGFIENLRRKPEAHRRKITLLASFSITGLIFIAWLVVVFNTFEITSNNVRGEAVEERPGPFRSLWGNFSSGVNEIGEQAGNLREISPF